ncbi:hypothetical protein TRFO_11039 [Tritrichomonas foetus]|uniref:Uncharacterized protein n=1 Tax=Tritrichomonas foetus TaxID=1144522 RepID=A0A1J4JBM1_9EUKA|nr:hypothetical protein TRFO_11039 [Tritrichomonas foetus]|eukprot:OHS94644.1 hypothetical protein TRFO_11039 [Tritrichomonas foetus]
MSESSLVSWLNAKGNGNLTSIEDAKTGREICYATVLLIGKPKYMSSVTIGKTTSECAANFTLVKVMIMNELNRPFPYLIAKLVDGNKEELGKLISELKFLDEQSQINDDGDDFSLDEFLNDLENDLEEQWKNCLEFRDALDTIAKQRDGYYATLKEVYRLMQKYPMEQVNTIHTLLTNEINDLKPVRKPRPH